MGASLIGADLSKANLTRANLSQADLERANLSGTDLAEVSLFSTKLLNVDLSALVNVPIEHQGPSIVDHRSIARSLQCDSLLPFLVDTGMPHVVAAYLIDSVQSLDSNGLFNILHSTFISYGGPDQKFAEKLQNALDKNGVKTFLFTKHAKLGSTIHSAIRSGIYEHDRVVLVCSESSLKRPGVLGEIELALRKETNEGGTKLLIPIALDDYIWTGWAPDNAHLKSEVLERVIGDAKGADTNKITFDGMLRRLLDALKPSK